MIMTDIVGGVQISLTNNATNPAGQFISELNLLFNTLPTGSNFVGDPYVTSISLGSYTDAGLSFNVEVRFKVSPPQHACCLEGLPTSSCSASLQPTLSGRTTARWCIYRTSNQVEIQARLSRLSQAA
jgi:hypothetical protein